MPELGHVGTALPSRPQAILDALAAGRVPVVAPLATGPLNVNADEAAAALAVGLGAERIVFLTDVPGVIRPTGHGSTPRGRRLLDDGSKAGSSRSSRRRYSAARHGVRAEIGLTEVVA